MDTDKMEHQLEAAWASALKNVQRNFDGDMAVQALLPFIADSAKKSGFESLRDEIYSAQEAGKNISRSYMVDWLSLSIVGELNDAVIETAGRLDSAEFWLGRLLSRKS